MQNTSSKWLTTIDDQLLYWNERNSNWGYFITFVVIMSFIFIGYTFMASNLDDIMEIDQWTIKMLCLYYMFVQWIWDILLKVNAHKISHSARHRKQHAMKIENQQQIWKLTERWDGSQTFINKMVSVC